MTNWKDCNPFRKLESRHAILASKTLSCLTWAMAVVIYVYFYRQLWHQNNIHTTGFAINSACGEMFWVCLLLLQLGYNIFVFTGDSDVYIATLGSHYILNNASHLGFIILYAHSFIYWTQLVLLMNFMNLSALYFRYNTHPRLIHSAVISGPLAWTFFAIYWNGILILPDNSKGVALIICHVFIWSILGYGLFFVFAYKDYTMAFYLGFLAAAIGVAQVQRQISVLQGHFAFIIMTALSTVALFLVFQILAVLAAQRRRFSAADQKSVVA